jgi:hypothetical protein
MVRLLCWLTITVARAACTPAGLPCCLLALPAAAGNAPPHLTCLAASLLTLLPLPPLLGLPLCCCSQAYGLQPSEQHFNYGAELYRTGLGAQLVKRLLACADFEVRAVACDTHNLQPPDRCQSHEQPGYLPVCFLHACTPACIMNASVLLRLLAGGQGCC